MLDVRPDGDVRIVTFANGAVVRELIVDVDDRARRIAYAVVDSPLQMTHHHATMEVLREGADRSRIVWIADVFPNAAAGQVGPMMEQGSEVMKRTLERTAPERPRPGRLRTAARAAVAVGAAAAVAGAAGFTYSRLR